MNDATTGFKLKSGLCHIQYVRPVPLWCEGTGPPQDSKNQVTAAISLLPFWVQAAQIQDIGLPIRYCISMLHCLYLRVCMIVAIDSSRFWPCKCLIQYLIFTVYSLDSSSEHFVMPVICHVLSTWSSVTPEQRTALIQRHKFSMNTTTFKIHSLLRNTDSTAYIQH